jgi:preprotein translocase subunit SecF
VDVHIIKSAKVDFMKIAKPLFVITWLFAIISRSASAFCAAKLFGVDFLGGDSTTLAFQQQKLGQERNPHRVAASGEKDAQIQYQKDAGSSGKET